MPVCAGVTASTTDMKEFWAPTVHTSSCTLEETKLDGVAWVVSS